MTFNERDGVSFHQRPDYLLNRLLRRRSKQTSKLHVTGLCEENSPVTGEFLSLRASNAEMFTICPISSAIATFQSILLRVRMAMQPHKTLFSSYVTEWILKFCKMDHQTHSDHLLQIVILKSDINIFHIHCIHIAVIKRFICQISYTKYVTISAISTSRVPSLIY